MSKMPSFSAAETTLSRRWRPLGPVLTDVVPLAISWNQTPFLGISVTSCEGHSYDILYDGKSRSPLKAQVRTTWIPFEAIL